MLKYAMKLYIVKLIHIYFYIILGYGLKSQRSYRHKSRTDSRTMNHTPVLLTNLCLLV